VEPVIVSLWQVSVGKMCELASCQVLLLWLKQLDVHAPHNAKRTCQLLQHDGQGANIMSKESNKIDELDLKNGHRDNLTSCCNLHVFLRKP